MKNFITNWTVFDGESSINMPPPEKCIFRKCCTWPCPSNSRPWKCHVTWTS